MGEIVKINKAIKIARELKKNNKKLVLVGGCFDILHVGHVDFLNKAKNIGDILMVLLESDERIKRLKGDSRPINNQADRAKLLNCLEMVDIVVSLPDMKSGTEYSELVTEIRPDVIAITSDDPIKDIKKLLAKRVGGKLFVVIKRREGYSTSEIVKKML